MIQILIYAMVYLGSALMVYNIFCFIQFARYIREMKAWDGKSSFLYVPIFLLVFFLLGYLSIGLFWPSESDHGRRSVRGQYLCTDHVPPSELLRP